MLPSSSETLAMSSLHVARVADHTNLHNSYSVTFSFSGGGYHSKNNYLKLLQMHFFKQCKVIYAVIVQMCVKTAGKCIENINKGLCSVVCSKPSAGIFLSLLKEDIPLS